MKKIRAILVLAVLLFAINAQADEIKNIDQAIQQCKTYDDYEKLCGELKDTAAGKSKDSADNLYYMIAKTRVEELSYLTKKNDIESGRIYMSVNEKYYNEAQDFLDKAAKVTKSKDLLLDIYLLKFSILKELLQQQKADEVFSAIADKISTYSNDKALNLAKLNEISKKMSDNGIAEYAMKLKSLYASKADPDAARMLADDMKANADKYLESGNVKEALSAYDTYIQLAENCYDPDAMAAKIMDIAEKYFEKKRYKEAIKYYSVYLSKYGNSRMADYASYKLALSYYDSKDYALAVSKFDEFLKTYQNSVWFEKGFEALCRLYYETSNTEKAVEYLQKLIGDYPRRDTIDYAYLLTGILYYSKPDYDKALGILKKIQADFPKSAYSYVTDTLISDINDIKKGAAPSYSFGSKDVYRTWEAYTPIGITINVGEGGQVIENKDAKPGELFVKTKPGSTVVFTMAGIEDLDRFNEYWQDKEDQSRLPREIKTGTEKDLVFFTWSCADNGKFLDDKQTPSRSWQAPDAPGDYTITITSGDIALVRPPDSGTRKDEPKTLTIHITVEK